MDSLHIGEEKVEVALYNNIVSDDAEEKSFNGEVDEDDQVVLIRQKYQNLIEKNKNTDKGTKNSHCQVPQLKVNEAYVNTSTNSCAAS